jgi:hypothetical protein
MSFGDNLQAFGAGAANLLGGLGSGLKDLTSDVIDHRTAIRLGRMSKNTINKQSRRQYRAENVASRQYGKVGVAEATGRRWGQSYADRGHLLSQIGRGQGKRELNMGYSPGYPVPMPQGQFPQPQQQPQQQDGGYEEWAPLAGFALLAVVAAKAFSK